MRYEKIIKRDDGSRVRIDVLYGEYRIGKLLWRVSVYTCQPRKRTWIDVINRAGHLFRGMTPEQMSAERKRQMLKVVSQSEIHDAMLEAWQMLKPSADEWEAR